MDSDKAYQTFSQTEGESSAAEVCVKHICDKYILMN